MPPDRSTTVFKGVKVEFSNNETIDAVEGFVWVCHLLKYSLLLLIFLKLTINNESVWIPFESSHAISVNHLELDDGVLGRFKCIDNMYFSWNGANSSERDDHAELNIFSIASNSQ